MLGYLAHFYAVRWFYGCQVDIDASVAQWALRGLRVGSSRPSPTDALAAELQAADACGMF